MSWLSRFFGGKATPEPVTPKMDEHALALITRQRLTPFTKGLKGPEELYVAAADWLAFVERRAAGSAMLGLTTNPQTARAAAKYSLQTRLLQGGMPFFYRPNVQKTIFTEDVYVRARDVAEHAGRLLKLGQVALASVYVEALEDRIEDMQNCAALTVQDYEFCSGKDMAAHFEIGADEDENRPIQPVLRQKYGTPAPL